MPIVITIKENFGKKKKQLINHLKIEKLISI